MTLRSTFRKRTRPAARVWPPSIHARKDGTGRRNNSKSLGGWTPIRVTYNRGTGPGTERAIALDLARLGANS